VCDPASGDATGVAIVIVRLGSHMDAERQAVAAMLRSELEESDAVALGNIFLEQFYYGRLLDDPDYFCFIYRIDESVAGFITFTTDLGKVYRRALRSSWWHLAAIVAQTVVRDPARIPALISVARTLLSLQQEPYSDIRAETLTTAVSRNYRSLEFFRRTGINVAKELYQAMALELLAHRVGSIKGFTRKSNVMVHAAIGALGWRKVWEGQNHRRRDAEPTCIWIWDVAQAAQRFGWATQP
jgi:hypothetical protein